MLNKILEVKREEISRLTLPEREGEPCVPFADYLKKGGSAGLIAEVKKASPSKGVIREDFDPVAIAEAYEAGGARAISVLTDQTFFQGNPEYLTAIKQHVSLPVMRKDFIIDSLQVQESRRLGADAILLIGEALDVEQLKKLYDEAYSLGMEVLVEVHALKTLHRILDVFTPAVLGINNRDLNTFHTSLTHTATIADSVPENCFLISESGIYTSEHVAEVKKAGAGAVLVGESLMRQSDVEEAVRQLLKEEN
ncbi:indole-3-glycerol phosphate synthase [Salimicrobium jeotgali]|uniref:Indole-3-glycerol phosphate synthase n=1 Tax=Salimicrobium jeotgali TaxID=1230341 RepID=K2GE70_9BACI|nr:indole-3-glycerol phosphate synthase TrpC [Salimicrobium jeotgali]AKG05103.1 indole-3-glycerol phosphate synthase [Salimicrobium jeotgali]EKE32532.1 indole-3-glycerol-phosphate synthase [Salimicrobium jeotgali]MBM7695485.1 indole-3-glycerol phosphate synthase [Salimicrobium jeotgali]